jgi:hypothetical protein
MRDLFHQGIIGDGTVSINPAIISVHLNTMWMVVSLCGCCPGVVAEDTLILANGCLIARPVHLMALIAVSECVAEEAGKICVPRSPYIRTHDLNS